MTARPDLISVILDPSVLPKCSSLLCTNAMTERIGADDIDTGRVWQYILILHPCGYYPQQKAPLWHCLQEFGV